MVLFTNMASCQRAPIQAQLYAVIQNTHHRYGLCGDLYHLHTICTYPPNYPGKRLPALWRSTSNTIGPCLGLLS